MKRSKHPAKESGANRGYASVSCHGSRGFVRRPISIIRTSRPLRLAVALLFIYLALAGVVKVTVMPIGKTPDVWEHLYRSSAILNGDIVARPVGSTSAYHAIAEENVGGCVDTALARLSVEYASDFDLGSIDPGSVPDWSRPCVDAPFNNTAVYSPTAYLPQLAGLMLGWLTGLDAEGIYRVVEAATLIVFLVAVMLALALLPRDGYRLALMVCLVYVAHQTNADMSISADSFAFAMLIVFAALLARSLDPLSGDGATRHPFPLSLMVGLILSGGLLAIGKIAYAPLLSVIWAVVIVRWRDMSAPMRAAGMIAVPAGWTLLLAWMRIGAHGYATSPTRVSQTIAEHRTARVISKPWEPMEDILWSVAHLQTHSEWDRFRLALWWLCMGVIGVGLLLWICCLHLPLHMPLGLRWLRGKQRQEEQHLHLRQSLHYGSNGLEIDNDSQLCKSAPWAWVWCWLMILASVTLCYLALWLQFTPDDATGVAGVQSRYFWIMAPLLVMAGMGICDAAARRFSAAARSVRCDCARKAFGISQ